MVKVGVRQGRGRGRQATRCSSSSRHCRENDRHPSGAALLELLQKLGALLQKRMIKPGEVVVHWAKSKGEHAGELSKVHHHASSNDPTLTLP